MHQVGKNSFRYKDVKRDSEGFADASLCSPFPYDLVECLLDDSDKVHTGWFTGESYVGLRMGEVPSILKWRKRSLHDEDS